MKQRSKSKRADPVFALIAEHRSALDKRAKADQRMNAVRARVEAKEKHLSHTRCSLMNEFPPLKLGTTRALNMPGEVPQHVEGALLNAGMMLGPRARRKLLALRSEAKDELLRMFNADYRKMRVAQKKEGITMARKAKIDAINCEQAILKRLAKVRPKTPAGLAALLDYMGELIEGADTLHGNFCWAGKSLRALAARVPIE